MQAILRGDHFQKSRRLRNEVVLNFYRRGYDVARKRLIHQVSAVNHRKAFQKRLPPEHRHRVKLFMLNFKRLETLEFRRIRKP